MGRAVVRMMDAFEAEVAMAMRPPATETMTLGEKVVKRADFAERHPGVVDAWDRGLLVTDYDMVVLHDPLPAKGIRMLTLQLQKLDIWQEDYLRMDSGAAASDTIELTRAREGVIEALGLSGAKWVLLVGAGVTSMWRTDINIKMARNRMHAWKDRWNVWCMESPAAVARAERNGTPFTGEWREGLLQFTELVRERAMAADVLKGRCIRCGNDAVAYDFDGVAACAKHGGKVAGGRAATRKHWHEEIEGQIGMEL